jgi:hypothetical protein
MKTVDLAELAQRGSDVQKLWALVLLLALKDSATTVCFDPSRGDNALTYIVGGTEIAMVPPPEHLAAQLQSTVEKFILRRSLLSLVSGRRKDPSARIEGDFTAKIGAHQVNLTVSIDRQGPVVVRLPPSVAEEALAALSRKLNEDGFGEDAEM